MGAEETPKFAREVRSGEKLVSRWAKVPPQQKDSLQLPSQAPTPPEAKPPREEPTEQPEKTTYKSASRLESRWASASSAPVPRHDRQRSHRRGSDSGHYNKPLTDTTSAQPSEKKWQLHSDVKPSLNHALPQQRRQQEHGSQRGQPKSHRSQRQHNDDESAAQNSGSRNEKPQENRLAQHLGLSSHDPDSRPPRSRRSRRSATASTETTATPTSAPATQSVWSLEGYEPGEDWATAEEEAFHI